MGGGRILVRESGSAMYLKSTLATYKIQGQPGPQRKTPVSKTLRAGKWGVLSWFGLGAEQGEGQQVWRMASGEGLWEAERPLLHSYHHTEWLFCILTHSVTESEFAPLLQLCMFKILSHCLPGRALSPTVPQSPGPAPPPGSLPGVGMQVTGIFWNFPGLYMQQTNGKLSSP